MAPLFRFDKKYVPASYSAVLFFLWHTVKCLAYPVEKICQ